jgi:hypothetical protein
MPGPFNFDAYLGWVNITDPNNIPEDARTIGADDMLRFENLGLNTKAKFAEVDEAIANLDSDTAVAESLAEPTSATRAAVQGMVDAGVEDFQAVIDAVPAQVDAKLGTDVGPAVAAAIAADGSIVAATVAAVDAEVQGRDLAEMPEILEDNIALAIVDEDGRRLWLESGYDAKPTDYSAGLIIEKIGPAITADVEASIGVENMPSAITGLSFVIVDEDGRILPDAQWGEDGKFTQAVIDSLSARLTFPAPPVVVEPTKLVIPAALPMVVGQTYKLHYSDFIDALDKNHTVLPNTGSRGVNYGDRWVFTPATAETFNLILNVFDRVGVIVKTKTIPITVYAIPSGAGKRHLAIGDSITRAGNYSGLATDVFAGAKTVGTRTYNDGVLNTEGRGGWALSGYFDNIGHESWGDSPFLFPVGIAGEKFWGATEFWKKVTTTDPNGYDYQGFQKIARGWAASGAPYLFNASGYPVSPAEGDVVVDATYAESDEWRQYTAGSWVRINPPAVEFNFSKYMARYAAAFPEGPPTSISIMLMTNDFYNAVDDTSFALWKSRMDTVIASVRAWSATVPFIILLAGAGGPPQNWALQSYHNQFEFNRLMRNAADRILAAYDTTTQRNNKVYVTTFLGSISPANMSDHVHPAVPAGHAEMSPYLAGMLAKLITEGA